MELLIVFYYIYVCSGVVLILLMVNGADFILFYFLRLADSV